MNNLYKDLNGKNEMQEKFEQFRRSFSGDPRAVVQGLLNSGKMSQQQFNQLRQMASSMFGANI